MKILILQLARLGDIFQTWPVLRAIKRSHPNAEIHFLTRSKFAPAAPGPEFIAKHWILDTRDILAPLVDEIPQIEAALDGLNTIVDGLRDEGFDKIINLSFSPFSSFLVKEIAGLTTEVKGYTRTSDGFLCIPDDGSAYVYAQVGVGRPNRIHLTDLFAFVSDVQIEERDWRVADVRMTSPLVMSVPPNPIVIHIGASDLAKTFPWAKWRAIVKGLAAAQPRPIVLIGSQDEYDLAVNVCAGIEENAPINLVGQTSLDEVFRLVQRAQLLIGGDSAPIHIASLTGTPALNISFPMVSFWETGPRSAKSRILALPAEGCEPSVIIDEAIGILNNKSTVFPAVRVAGPTYPYIETKPMPGVFTWDLVRALYMNEDFPPAPNEIFLLGLKRLSEVAALAREQLATLRGNSANTAASAILDRVVEVIEKIEEMVPDTSPIVRWFKTELIRIGPMPVAALIEATDEIYARLGGVAALYVPEAPFSGENESNSAKDEKNDDANLG